MQKVEAVFAELLELAPPQRGEALRRLCGSDASLAREVWSLLQHHQDDEGSFLDPDGLRAIAEAASREPILDAGTRFAGYTILGPLGEGGMGLVYRAQQERPRRTVAIKVIRAAMLGSTALKRFEREAEVLGLLQHPGIAQIFEAGWGDTDDGPRPFIAMELVDGPPLARYVRERNLTVRERLELIARVCDAVHHAHQRGVIHRDLKPGNILIDPSGQPKVLDFGVSRADTGEGMAITVHTHAGQLIGTLAYMSPEQASGDADAVDVRSDVWALGVVMFELLTGRYPYDLASKPVHEAARLIHDTEPARLTDQGRQFRGDLTNIVGKALERDRSRRYQSAAQLADDIRAHLAGAPISAKQDSFVYVASKLMRRHKLAAAMIQVSLLVLVAFALFAWRQARAQERLAAGERAARLAADHARNQAAQTAQDLRRNLYVSAIGHAQAAYASRDADRMRRVLDECPADERGWEWAYLKRLADSGTRVRTLPENGVCFAAVCEDTSAVLTWAGLQPVRLLDGATGDETVRADIENGVAGIAISPDGSLVVRAGVNGDLYAMEHADRGFRRVLSRPGVVMNVTAVSSRRGLALLRTAPDERTVNMELLDVRAGRIVGVVHPGPANTGVFSPDGSMLALALSDGRVLVRPVDTEGTATYPVHAGHVWSVRFSPDGRRLASGGQDGVMGLIDLDTGLVRRLPISDNKVLALAWSPDGSMVAASGTEPGLRVVETRTPRVFASLLGHAARVESVAWGAKGLVSTSRDGTARWWDDPRRDPTLPRTLPGGVTAVAVDPGGNGVYAGVDRGRVMILSPVDLAPLDELPAIRDDISVLHVSPDGRRVVASCYSGLVVVFDVCNRRIESVIAGTTGRSLKLAFHPDSRRLLLGSDAESATIWDAATGALLDTLPEAPLTANAVAWSPDGALIAVGHVQSGVQVFDAATRRELRRLQGVDQFPYYVEFSPDGRSLYAGDEGGNICVWDVGSGELVRRLKGHQHGVYVQGFSPDGARIVTGGWDNTIRVWDTADGHELLSLRGHTGGTPGAVFTPDGSAIISASTDATIRIWSARPLPTR